MKRFKGQGKRSFRRGHWTSPDDWKERTAVATLTCETNSLGKTVHASQVGIF